MTPQQLINRVQKEADARFGETIERLLFLLEYEQRMKDSMRRCYCDQFTRSFIECENNCDSFRVCENCRDS